MKAELERRFAEYFRQMESCRKHGLGWALVHLVLVMPDICAALASPNGWTTDAKYVAWCNRYLPDLQLTGNDWRAMRNIVLHQGRSVPEGRSVTQYRRFIFEAPEGNHHKATTAMPDGTREITVNVGQLQHSVQAGMRAWFADVDAGMEEAGARFVSTHLDKLVRVTINVTLSEGGPEGGSVVVTTT